MQYDRCGSSAACDGRPCRGPHWRCGPIDQHGNALAEVKCIQVQYLGGGAFQLTGEDGGMETFSLP